MQIGHGPATVIGRRCTEIHRLNARMDFRESERGARSLACCERPKVRITAEPE